MIDRIAELMRYETAGDPMTGLKWTRKTTEKIAQELQEVGIQVGARTVARLLKKMGYSLRVNHKKLSRATKTSPEDRNAQFEHITALRVDFAARRVPVISVDTKKKELIGRFKNPGAAWNRQAIEVSDHDFPSQAIGKAVPYGIYDLQANRGTVVVGTSCDTAEFAVDAIEGWWRTEGRRRYPKATQLAILADCGGSNGPRSRAWKHALYHRLTLGYGLTVIVAHYPPGTSKWNPIEHRLFCEISKNWAGRPLDSYEAVINYIGTTTTRTGLQVEACLMDKEYATGVKILDQQMDQLRLASHPTLPKLNYALIPPGSGSPVSFPLLSASQNDIDRPLSPVDRHPQDKPVACAVPSSRNGLGTRVDSEQAVPGELLVSRVLRLGRTALRVLSPYLNGTAQDQSNATGSTVSSVQSRPPVSSGA